MKIISTKVYKKKSLNEQIDEASLYNARVGAERAKANLDAGASSLYNASAIDAMVAGDDNANAQNQTKNDTKNIYHNIKCVFGESKLAMRSNTSTVKAELNGRFLISQDVRTNTFTITDPDNRNEYISFKVSNLVNGILEDKRYYDIDVLKVTPHFITPMDEITKIHFKGLYINNISRRNNTIHRI